VLLAALVALFTLSTAAGAPSQRFSPTAVAFSDATHGELGLSSRHSGAIAVTSDGGKTWRITQHTARPIVGLAFFHDAYYVELDNGRLTTGQRFSFSGRCGKPATQGGDARVSADIVDTNIVKPWSICVGMPGAGNQAKAVYRGSKRVAFRPGYGHGAYGGLSLYGYPAGIAGAEARFGIIWPGARGWVAVTRDGGHHWHGVRKILQSDGEAGLWATTVGDTGFLLVATPSTGQVRLVETKDAGRTWRVVHRWR
jgi:photosystem II stability/assembly factor-like uncharacterized protein